jgi:hypothetical protein
LEYPLELSIISGALYQRVATYSVRNPVWSYCGSATRAKPKSQIYNMRLSHPLLFRDCPKSGYTTHFQRSTSHVHAQHERGQAPWKEYSTKSHRLASHPYIHTSTPLYSYRDRDREHTLYWQHVSKLSSCLTTLDLG